MIKFRPKLLDTLPGYSRAQLGQDLSAGLTVGVLALPLAMAFAIASGMSPTAGIWTAIVAGLLIALFGGSRVQIGGPTGAFIPIIYGIVAQYGVQNLLIATMLAGAMLVGLALARLGSLIRFIPRTVVIGFTNGIAVVIFLAQIKDFLGLPIENLPAEFFAKVQALATAIPHADLPTVALAFGSLGVLLGWNRAAKQVPWMARVPGPLAVLVLATAANALFALPVETIGSRFGGIPQSIPPISLPALTLSDLGRLISPAITIALLGAIESLLSARVADAAIDDRHDPNQELMAQGIANLAAPLFGGFAATGAIARTATNVRSGGRTPVAGIAHAITLLLVVLIAAPLAAHVPLATLSAIVVLVAVNMGEWHEFRELRRYSMNYRVVLLATFVITVIFDLTLAVEIGMVLASLFFIYRVQTLSGVERVVLPAQAPDGSSNAGIMAFQVFGSMFFGTVGKIEDELDPEQMDTTMLVLDMHKVISLDTTALEMLDTLLRDLRKRGSDLVLCGLNKQPGSIIQRSGFLERLGSNRVCDTLQEGIEEARMLRRLA
ncbi:SulP family inorganic anion transporter [Niveibacterium sp. 24ML]|uniref:SulP family inorganic anion transporter n=1 Tax=Niveibacterium sp. 24ML TaxID=2985512 RepID=UPI00226F9EB5|nr:SulP family inorganic anion transporter [Niveibacterium sp. 24ML]MCX9155036.1 SulP family inorganic anion transporter [Niveibacterium sp. 24ML]